MERTRLGLIGCGGNATGHARHLAPLADRVRVTAAVDIVEERAQKTAEAFAGARAVTDADEILGDVDAVLVSLPHDLHADAAVRFLEAGKHVLVEKPLANTEADARRVIDAANRAKRTLMVGYCMRYHPLVRKLKQLLDEQTYGQVFQLSMWTEQHTQYPEGHWGLRAQRLGGGQFFSHGCHYIDLLLWCLGAPKRGLHIGTRRGTPWMEMEGTSNVTLEFESGALGYHFGTWGARGTRHGNCFQAHCTDGMLELDIKRGTLSLYQDKEVTELESAESCKPMTAQMSHFLDCVESGGRPETDGVSSLEGLRVIWKLYEAERAQTMADLHGEGLGQWSPDKPLTPPATAQLSAV